MWKLDKEPVKDCPKVPFIEPKKTETSASTIIAEEVVFGFGQTPLSYVSKEVHLKSERLRYEIDVTYPQIIGAENSRILKLNRRIKQLVTEKYQWPLNPSKKDLRYYREKWPGVFNSVEINYEIRLATDSWFSIQFTAYS